VRNFLWQRLILTCRLCPVKLFVSFSILFECISFSLFSSGLRRNAKISKDTRSKNSRIPDLRSLHSPWQSYKKASPRVEGSFQWNEPLRMWKRSKICEEIVVFFMAVPPLSTNIWKNNKYSLSLSGFSTSHFFFEYSNVTLAKRDTKANRSTSEVS